MKSTLAGSSLETIACSYRIDILDVPMDARLMAAPSTRSRSVAGTELASTSMSGKAPRVGAGVGDGVGRSAGLGVGTDEAVVDTGVGNGVGLGLGAGVGTVLAGAGVSTPSTIVKVYVTAQRTAPLRFFRSNSSATIV